MDKYTELFETRWRQECAEPCVGNWDRCKCRQWAATQNQARQRMIDNHRTDLARIHADWENAER